jgi:glycosyltransferase involved in cell wall biosynthesis
MQKKIAVLIKCRTDPSSYYRLFQYFQKMKEEGENVIIYEQIPEKLYLWYYNSNQSEKLLVKLVFWLVGVCRTFVWIQKDHLFFHSDIIVLNRKFFARKMPILLKYVLNKYLKKRKLIWDFDDNIIDDKEISEQELFLVSEISENIIVTSQYLKDKLDSPAQQKTYLLPTTDMDLKDFNYKDSIDNRLYIYDFCFNMLWIGSKHNIEYLKTWITDVDKLAGRLNKKICLYIVCNIELDYSPNNFEIKNVKWNRMDAIEIMKKCHIGLMPLIEDNYTLGKAGFKIVQYFGASIPAVASEVGFNKNIIEEGKNGYLISTERDLSKMENLILDKELWKFFAINARKSFEEKFSPIDIFVKWKKMLNDTECM